MQTISYQTPQTERSATASLSGNLGRQRVGAFYKQPTQTGLRSCSDLTTARRMAAAEPAIGPVVPSSSFPRYRSPPLQSALALFHFPLRSAFALFFVHIRSAGFDADAQRYKGA